MSQTPIDVIEQLEGRLQRIEYVVSGHLDKTILKDDTRLASMRLRDLEQGLNQLISKSRVIQDLLKLNARHPDFFHSTEPREVPSSLDTVSKSSMVLAAASSFHQTASRLTSVNDTPLPTAELSTQLIEAAVRAARIEVLQESQSREIAALKQRSAAVLQWWYSVDILQVGESWADLEGRVEAVEQAVRRVNSARQHDGGII